MTDAVTNWAGNVRFAAARTHRPASVAEMQALVAGSHRAKALGTGHCFNRIADTAGELISTAGLPRTIGIDDGSKTATVGAGVRYGELAVRLHERGLALPNLASLPHLSIGGAVATGTHGSGDGNGVLATAVRALRLVTADGELRTISGERLAPAVVGLGALGVVTELTLDLVESYRIQQFAYTGLTRERLIADLDEIFAAAYSVSVFTRWQQAGQIWLKRLAGARPPAPRWLGAALAREQQLTGPGADPRAATPQLGVAGPWHERLPHFRMQFRPSWGAELQSEYFLARPAAAAAIEAVFGMRELLAPVLLVSEIRTMAGDELWLSPAHGHAALALHFTWTLDEAAVAPVVTELERRLAPFDARPHWGKVFSTDPATVARLYPRLGEFAGYARELDPSRTFANGFLDRYLPGG